MAAISEFSFCNLAAVFLSILDTFSDLSALTPLALYVVEPSIIKTDPLELSTDFKAPDVAPEITKLTAIESFPEPINRTPFFARLTTPAETKDASSYLTPLLIFPLSTAFCRLAIDNSVQLFRFGLLKPRLGKRM